MALTFNGTSSKLTGSNIVTGYPCSMFCWIRPNNVTADQMVMGAGDNGGATECAMQGAGAVAGDPMRAFVRNTSGQSSAASSTDSMSVGTWQPALIIIRSTTSRSVYFGSNLSMVTENTSRTLTFANFDRFVVGCRPISDTMWLDADVAHVAVWNRELTDDDWINLKYGATPSGLHYADLVDYWSLDSHAATQTGVKGNVLTAANTATASTSPTMGQTIPNTLPVRANGIWTWFSEPRAVYYNGATYIGWVDSQGSVGVTKFINATGARTFFVLSQALEIDDHDNVAIHILSDGRIAAFYSKHNDASGNRYRISTNAEDISAWGSEVVISSGTVSYSNPIRLSQDSTRNWLFYRSGSGGASTSRLAYKTTTDMAAWSAQTNVWESPSSTAYYKLASDGVNKVHIVATNFHPVQGQSSIYHFYMQLDGSNVPHWYKSDGTEITDALPHYTADATLVYDGSTIRGWIWDITIGADGHPRILGTRYPNNDGSDIRYMYWRWTGSAWVQSEVTADGAGLYDPEIYYAGGIAFDANDSDVIYLSAPISGVREIQKWVTSNSGSTWSKAADITSGTTAGTLNARPYSPRNAANGMKLLYWRGSYTSFTSYDTDIYFESGVIAGSFAVTESGSDTASISGDVLISGSFSATESGSDTAAMTGVGQSGVTGSLAATESGSDSASFAGDVLVQGTLSATESGSDTAAATGTVLVQGALAATEAGTDTAAMTGDASGAIVGSLSAVESGSDTASAAGAVLVSGTAAITEVAADTAIVVGVVLVTGVISAAESGSDTAAFTNVSTGVLAAARRSHTNVLGSAIARRNTMTARRPRNLH